MANSPFFSLTNETLHRVRMVIMSCQKREDKVEFTSCRRNRTFEKREEFFSLASSVLSCSLRR